jgi:hypothetical protein
MLKIFFWILLLANAGLVAWQQGYLETLWPSGREPGRMSNQLNADKVRVIPPPATTGVAAAPPAPAPAPVPATVAAEPEQKPETLACTEVGNFNRQEAGQFETKLPALALSAKVSKRPIKEVATHIVYIPPLPDLESAEKKVGELRRLGITDYYIIQDNSPLRMGISLGIFKQEEAARDQLAKLNQRGVRSARIGARSVTSTTVAFQLRDLDAAGRENVGKLAATFPKSEIRPCEPS